MLKVAVVRIPELLAMIANTAFTLASKGNAQLALPQAAGCIQVKKGKFRFKDGLKIRRTAVSFFSPLNVMAITVFLPVVWQARKMR
jgi:hypothetical protein